MIRFDEISLDTVCRHVSGEPIRHLKFEPIDVVRAAIYLQLTLDCFKDLIHAMGRIKTSKWASIYYIIFYHYGMDPYMCYDFVYFIEDWIVQKFGLDPKAVDHLSLPNRKLKHYTTLRRFCREFMQIFRDCAQYRRYSRTYQKRKCPICKSTFYRSPDEQDRVLTQCFCCTRRSKFCPSCFETVPSIPEEILRAVGITGPGPFLHTRE